MYHIVNSCKGFVPYKGEWTTFSASPNQKYCIFIKQYVSFEGYFFILYTPILNYVLNCPTFNIFPTL